MAARPAELVGPEADRGALRRELRDGRNRGVSLRPRAPTRAPGRAGAPSLRHVAVCTDASSLLAPPAASELGVAVVPIPVALDGNAFDGSTDDFYARVRAGALATTSQPSPAAFAAAYAHLAARGAEAILSLHLDARASGVAASAERAAREAPVDVLVADLPTASYGVALCVRAACAALDGGATAHEARDVADTLAARLDNVFVARAAPTGRVAASDTWGVLRFADGAAQGIAACDSIAEAVTEMGRRVVAGRPVSTAVGYASRAVEAAADTLAHDLLRKGVGPVERYRVEPSVGAHTGPDAFGAFWLP